MLNQLRKNRLLFGVIYSGVLLSVFVLPLPFSAYMLLAAVILSAAAVGSTPNFRKELVFTLVKFRVSERRLAQSAGILGFLLTAVGTGFFTFGGQNSARTGLGWCLAGGFALAAALVLNPAADFMALPQHDIRRYTSARRIRWIATILGAVMLALLAEINGDFFDPSFLSHVRSDRQLALWVMGPLLLAYGLAGKSTNSPPRRPKRTMNPLPAFPIGGGGEKPPAWNGRRRLGLLAPALKNLFRRLCASRFLGTRRFQNAATVMLIVILALGVRLYQLEDGAKFFIDEIHFSNPVQHFYNSDEIELLLPFSSVAAFPYLYPYLEWFTVEVFGRNLVGLRMVSVLFGTANVLALYLLTRELFDRKTALTAAALLAVFPPHVHFSRMGLNNIADPFFGTLAVYFIARGLNPARSMRANFAWAGAMLGLTQYFYEGGRLLFPALVIWWLMALAVWSYLGISGETLFAWWQTRSRRDLNAFSAALRRLETIRYREMLTAVVILALAAILVAAPVYYTLVGQDRDIMTRLDTAGLKERARSDLTDLNGYALHISNRFFESFLIHTTIAEAGLYYAGKMPLMLAVITPFFMLGAFYALWRTGTFLRFAGCLLALLWIILAWLGNTLLEESRLSPRYVVEFPALCLLAAVGIRAAVEVIFFTAQTPPLSPLLAGGQGTSIPPANSYRSPSLFTARGAGGGVATHNRLLLVIITTLAVVQIWYYFGPHLTTFRQQFRDAMGRDAHDVLFRAADFPPDTHIYLIGSHVYSQRDASDLMAYLNPDVTIYTLSPAEINPAYMQALVADRSRAFFVEQEDERIVNLLHLYFPDIEGPFYSPQDNLPVRSQYMLYWSAPKDTTHPSSPDVDLEEKNNAAE